MPSGCDTKRLVGAVSDRTAPKLLEDLIRTAERAGASDVHLHMRDGHVSIVLRLNGVMTAAGELDAETGARVLGRVKYLGKLKTYQESLPQDGRIDRETIGSQNDIRVSTYPTVTGEKIVLRLFSGSAARTLSELGLEDAPRMELENVLRQTYGLLLLTGPAGSGKTTTIYGCLRRLSEQGGRHIITIEDPVEQVIEGVMQTEVNEPRGLTYGVASRHLLRQDPEVLVIGEIRDDETARLAVRAALTGHLVISTLHASSCQGVLERLLVMCPDAHAVVSAIEMILNQRLLRRVCSDCKGDGCENCFRTGYRGRLPVVEWFHVDGVARKKLRDEGPEGIVPAQGLEAAALSLVSQGLTTATEVERVIAAR